MVRISPEQLALIDAETARRRLDFILGVISRDMPEIEERALRERVQAALRAADAFEFDDDEAVVQLASVTAALGADFLQHEAVQKLLGLELDCADRMDLLLRAIEAG